MIDDLERVLANVLSGPFDATNYREHTEIDPGEVIGYRFKQYTVNFFLIIFFIVVMALMFSGGNSVSVVVQRIAKKAGSNAASVNPIGD